MPVFTSIGLALGASAATALAVGTAATIGATAIGVGAYAAGGGFDSKKSSAVDSRVESVVGTGELTEAEAQTAAKKRAFRSGVLFTSPTGLDSDPRTSSAKLR